jgi:hypothetical protein
MATNLNEYIKHNRTDRFMCKKITCKDGFSISVQASEYHYCEPRITNDTEYYSVECGFPSSIPEFIMDYCEDQEDPTDTVYAYVPIKLVEQLIDHHGGIDIVLVGEFSLHD